MPVVISGTNGVSGVDGTASNPSYEGTDSNTGIFFPAADTIAFAEGGTEVARFDSSGNFGIGTSSPTSRLHLAAAGDVSGRAVNSATTGSAVFNVTNNSGALAQLMIYGSAQSAYGALGSGESAIYATTSLTLMSDTGSGVIKFATGGNTERMRIDSSGNVGIGTSSPSFKLDVVGNAKVGNVYGTGLTVTVAGNSITYPTDNTLAFNTNSTERARIDSSGNLLVGTTTFPTSSVSAAGLGLFVEPSGGSGRINSGKTASGTFSALANYHAGTYVGGINFSNTATSLVASSDERLKENIVAAPSALEKAMSIEVVSYDWKHDPTHVEFGLVAQRLNSIYSEAVNVGDDGEEVEKTWGVEYGRLTPMLLKAIQEQQQMIETLQAKVAALEAK